MNLEKNVPGKPINYGRGGDRVDIEALALENIEKLKKGSLPEKKEEKYYDLAGELKKDVEAEPIKKELSAVEIDGVTSDLRSQFSVVEGAVKHMKFAGLDKDTLEKLKIELETIKKEILGSSNAKEEVYKENESDSDEVKKAKNKLKTAVEYIEQLS
jgi:hypothetical protein